MRHFAKNLDQLRGLGEGILHKKKALGVVDPRPLLQAKAHSRNPKRGKKANFFVSGELGAHERSQGNKGPAVPSPVIFRGNPFT